MVMDDMCPPLQMLWPALKCQDTWHWQWDRIGVSSRKRQDAFWTKSWNSWSPSGDAWDKMTRYVNKNDGWQLMTWFQNMSNIPKRDLSSSQWLPTSRVITPSLLVSRSSKEAAAIAACTFRSKVKKIKAWGPNSSTYHNIPHSYPPLKWKSGWVQRPLLSRLACFSTVPCKWVGIAAREIRWNPHWPQGPICIN